MFDFALAIYIYICLHKIQIILDRFYYQVLYIKWLEKGKKKKLNFSYDDEYLWIQPTKIHKIALETYRAQLSALCDEIWPQ